MPVSLQEEEEDGDEEDEEEDAGDSDDSDTDAGMDADVAVRSTRLGKGRRAGGLRFGPSRIVSLNKDILAERTGSCGHSFHA